MIDLAQTYLGCSKAQLAAVLNRDPAKVAPDSGNPKLDMVMGLSDVLDWPAGDVAEALWRDPVGDEVDGTPLPDKSFVDLNREAIEAHRAGDHALMRRIASQMLRIASTPVERGKAANRMMGAFEQAGRYGKALEWARVAASEAGVSPSAHLIYRANLAASNFAAWNLHEAASIAKSVLDDTADRDNSDLLLVGARCIAGYISGNACRRLMAQLPERLEQLGLVSLRDLDRAANELRTLALLRNDDTCNGIANTCDGARIEVEVLLGRTSASDAADRLWKGLDAVVDPSTHPRGDWLESWGWWAVFGLNIVTNHLQGDQRDRLAAVFSTKAHEIADRLENWAIRERAFTLEHDWRLNPRGTDVSGNRQWILDRDDIRSLLGTMGRFSWFRHTGWRILESARVV